MYTKLVKDLMIPVDLYPTVNQNATMLEAISKLKKATGILWSTAALRINESAKAVFPTEGLAGNGLKPRHINMMTFQ